MTHQRSTGDHEKVVKAENEKIAANDSALLPRRLRWY